MEAFFIKNSKIDMNKLIKPFLIAIVSISSINSFAQDNKDDLEKLLGEEQPKKEYVKNAFKSNRVIQGHSMEMTGKGVLDFRILHRFGEIKGGWREMFGLDQASMRMGFDYGVNKDLTIGIGRSTLNKEVDGYVKYRIIQQSKGAKSFPISILWISGATMQSLKATSTNYLSDFSNRLGYYHQMIVGRKMGDKFTLQLSPTLVHRNIVATTSDNNNILAIGIGARAKLTNRMALILDTYPIVYGAREAYNYFPLSLGVDIETGGHVFQLHITNSKGMNEKAFIGEITQNWGKGQIQIGFNLSRVFTIVKNTDTSW
jgi:hypothetical protein